MTPDGQVKPALVGPWTMGRDKKNPKPLDSSAFNTLVKTAAEFVRRHEQQLHAALHQSIDIAHNGERVSVALDIAMGQKLVSVPRFDQVVVSANGGMARMRTVHPLHFARIKRQLSKDPHRDPRKKAKDVAQADMVQALVKEYLPHLGNTAEGAGTHLTHAPG